MNDLTVIKYTLDYLQLYLHVQFPIYSWREMGRMVWIWRLFCNVRRKKSGANKDLYRTTIWWQRMWRTFSRNAILQIRWMSRYVPSPRNTKYFHMYITVPPLYWKLYEMFLNLSVTYRFRLSDRKYTSMCHYTIIIQAQFPIHSSCVRNTLAIENALWIFLKRCKKLGIQK